MREFSVGRIFVTFIIIWGMIASYIFDWNHTHIFNPRWPPHAKFHNAQDMLLGTVIGLVAFWVLWIEKIDRRSALGISTVLASLYWITQAGALTFPGTALFDPEFSYPGQPPGQLIMDAVGLGILLIGYLLERRRISKMT